MEAVAKKQTERPACLKKGPAWLMFVICLIGTFSAFYPGGSLSVLLPSIQLDLGIDTSLIVFINIAVSLVSAVLTLPFGRWGDRIGYQKLFIWGQAVLIVGNLASALLSLNFVLLIVFRCVLAVGSAMVQSVVQAMLTQAYPATRGRMMGLYSLSVSYSGSFSPLISGAIKDALSWQLALLFGVFFSVIALILGIVFLGKFENKASENDKKGTILLVITISSLLMALNSRTITMPVYVIIALAAVFVISMVFFVKTENKAKAPLLDFKLLKNKQFSLGFVGCLLAYLVSTGANTALPFFIQNVKGETATISSLCTMGFSLVMGTLGPLTGGWTDKKGPHRFMLAGMSIQCISIIGYVFLTEGSPLWMVVACVVIYGLGGGLFYAPITSMVMGSVPASSGGVASGMMSTSRNLGGAIGATIFSICCSVFKAGGGVTENQAYISGQRLSMIIMLALNLLNIFIMLVLFIRSKKQKAAEAE